MVAVAVSMPDREVKSVYSSMAWWLTLLIISVFRYRDYRNKVRPATTSTTSNVSSSYGYDERSADEVKDGAGAPLALRSRIR